MPIFPAVSLEINWPVGLFGLSTWTPEERLITFSTLLLAYPWVLGVPSLLIVLDKDSLALVIWVVANWLACSVPLLVMKSRAAPPKSLIPFFPISKPELYALRVNASLYPWNIEPELVFFNASNWLLMFSAWVDNPLLLRSSIPFFISLIAAPFWIFSETFPPANASPPWIAPWIAPLPKASFIDAPCCKADSVPLPSPDTPATRELLNVVDEPIFWKTEATLVNLPAAFNPSAAPASAPPKAIVETVWPTTLNADAAPLSWVKTEYLSKVLYAPLKISFDQLAFVTAFAQFSTADPSGATHPIIDVTPSPKSSIKDTPPSKTFRPAIPNVPKAVLNGCSFLFLLYSPIVSAADSKLLDIFFIEVPISSKTLV